MGDFIVRNQVAALLRRRQVTEFDAGDGLQTETPRRREPSVARNNTVLAVQKDRIREPELLDTGCDLGDLLLGMRPGISFIRNQRIQGTRFDTPPYRRIITFVSTVSFL